MEHFSSSFGVIAFVEDRSILHRNKRRSERMGRKKERGRKGERVEEKESLVAK